MGEDPVAPPLPSIVMKSHPECDMNSRSSSILPAAILTPIGLPPVLSLSVDTMSLRSSGEFISGNLDGLWMSCPGGFPRISAIAGVTLAPGRCPPMPGLVPWPILISTAEHLPNVASLTLYLLGTYSKM